MVTPSSQETPTEEAGRASRAGREGGTPELILDVAQELIQTRGFSAISYQDISERIGIRKASIHGHFRTKFQLGTAVIRRYRERLAQAFRSAEPGEHPRYADLLDLYFAPYLEVAGTAERVCLCGALSGEFLSLPPEMRAEVARFFSEHEDLLETVLERGQRAGEFHLTDSPRQAARLFLSALQGALLLRRSTGHQKQVHEVVKGLKKAVLVRGASPKGRRRAKRS